MPGLRALDKYAVRVGGGMNHRFGLYDAVGGTGERVPLAIVAPLPSDALLTVGRAEEGREWMARAAAVDEDGVTDAAERLAEIDGVSFVELDEDEAPATTGTESPAAD